jgi:hypothetical protein
LGTDSLGDSDPTVRFPWKFGTPQTTGGYTTPLWNGYDTIAVADVTFTGGGDIATQLVDVDGTSAATKPADPTKPGREFIDWFEDDETTPFDFNTPITGDTALTARFEAAPGAPGTPDTTVDSTITGLTPTITGIRREGKTLRASTGTLNPTNTTATYTWRANGKTIKGANKPWLTLRKAHAGRTITVTITAKAPGTPAVTKTSAPTKIVSSAKRRIVLSTNRAAKGQPLTVTATGFKARQKVTVRLDGDKRYTGRADSRGVLTTTVTFAKNTKPGRRSVLVTSYRTDGEPHRSIHTTIKYRR